MANRAQYYAIKNSLSATEKVVINFFELQWHLRHTVPTHEEIIEYVNRKYEKESKSYRLKHTALNYYFQRRVFTKALEDRGIPWKQGTIEDLTPTQVAAAVTVMNMADTRSIPDKLDQLGVNPSQYYAWLNDPQFKTMIDNLADQNLANVRPAAIAEFTKKINAGDWNAIKYWLETTGELTSGAQPQSEQLLRMIIEIIQDEVKDPNTIIRIAQRIKSAALNKTLEVVDTRPALTGEVVQDEEVARAQKMLGFG